MTRAAGPSPWFADALALAYTAIDNIEDDALATQLRADAETIEAQAKAAYSHPRGDE